MMKILENDYLSLAEFMEKEKKDFSKFIAPPLFVTEPEREFLEGIMKIEEQAPGLIKYVSSLIVNQAIMPVRCFLEKSPVTAVNNLRLFSLVNRVCKNLGITMPRVYLYTEVEAGAMKWEYFNAFTCGDKEKLYVFVGEGLLAAGKFTDEEIMSLIGHELGHAMSNHTLKQVALVSDNMNISQLITPEGRIRLAKLRADNLFSRYCEITADRAGVIACRSVESAISMIKKLDEISEHRGWEFDHSKSTHPNHKTRVEAMELFGRSMLYKRVLELIDHVEINDRVAYPLTAQELQEKIDELVK